ncbi:hypothetical protein QTN25_008349 [Entamoeba marina]
MVSLTFLESQMMCIKLILDNVLPNMTHFPSKITTLQEIEGFKNDVIQSIQKTFTLPSSVLLSSVFLFGMELGKLKKYWKNRTQKENIDVVKEVIESMKKYSSIIDIVFSQQMKDLIQNIYQKAEIEDSFDMMNEIQTIEDHFIWNNELSNQCQTTFISNGEIKQEYKHILPMFH